MKERLRYRSWTIGAKTLVSHALLALFAIVFACVVAIVISFIAALLLAHRAADLNPIDALADD